MHKILMAFLFFQFTLFTGELTAQYDFPAVTNGLSIGLQPNGTQTVYATDFLNLSPDTCTSFGELLINRSTLQFPRGDAPPAGAADSIVFTCDDFDTESVEVWYRNRFGDWLVADTYVVIDGLGDCEDCELAECAGTSPLLYNGLALSFGNVTEMALPARYFVARFPLADETFSYSPDPADSVLNLNCALAGTELISIYSHRPGWTSVKASTYLSLTGCELPIGVGQGSIIVQGLSVPNSSAGVVSMPVEAFQPVNVPEQQLRFVVGDFSPYTSDTLMSLTCDLIGLGGIFREITNTTNGFAGQTAFTYLTGDDTQNRCADAETNTAANDSIRHAVVLDSCRLYEQFVHATRDASDHEPGDERGGSVWYTADWENDIYYAGAPTLEIRPLDSLYLTTYFQNPLDTADYTAEFDTLIAENESIRLFECIILNGRQPPLETSYFTISAIRPGEPARYFLRVVNGLCPSSVSERTEPVTIRAFPNPTDGRFTLDLPTDLRGAYELSVFSLDGKIVVSRTGWLAGQNRLSAGLPAAPSGIYVGKLRVGGQVFSWRMMVE